MKVVKIRVFKLFGMFNHEIVVNNTDKITIIHGPNGIGKSTMLRIIDLIFANKFFDLSLISFGLIMVFYDDSSVLYVKKKRSHDAGITFIYNVTGNEGKEIERFNYFPDMNVDTRGMSRPFPLGMVDEWVEEVDRISLNKWQVLENGEVLSIDDVVNRYRHQFPPDVIENFSKHQEPPWLQELLDKTQVQYIQTERLTSRTIKPSGRQAYHSRRVSQHERRSVTNYSRELVYAIKDKTAEFGTISQKLDRSFPWRLVREKRREGDVQLDDGVLIEKLAELDTKRKRMMDIGLYDKSEDSLDVKFEEINDMTRMVLDVYIDDMDKKINILEHMAARIELLLDLINGLYMYKELKVTKDEGFVIITRNGAELKPTDLSSGEQHELVLLYELLFKTKPGSLVLIDEPELSLHIAWQKQIITNLQKVSKLIDFDVIMATHSPQIIGNRWDLTVELGE